MEKSQLLIGAASSGSGKTTFTLGLLRALRNRGMNVQPFKCGPDYLDPKHHTEAAGREAYNLDSFMASARHMQQIYLDHSEKADVCITEGVMGLFDGYNTMRGSSAEIAEILDIPVILIVNARSTAYTVAAILYGLKHFNPRIRIAGAIFNFVGSPAHYSYLKQACQDVGIEPLGYLPKCQQIEIPSRHLGLNIDREFCFDEFANRIAEQVEKTVAIDRLLEICTIPQDHSTNSTVEGLLFPSSCTKSRDNDIKLRISIARDEAFNFIYPENIRTLSQIGKISYFSPLVDQELPVSDFIYLPGGYPEFYLKQLSSNENMRHAIFEYCQKGGHLLAECGGMMYLGQYINDENGMPYSMCNFLPQGATMENMKLHLGYRKVFMNGQEYRGHEFHYSKIIPGENPLSSIARVTNAKDMEIDTPIYRQKNVIASYIHFYWAESPHIIRELIGL